MLTGITGALPKRPPKLTTSPTSFPYTGITRTAVVFLLTTPIEISSAIMPQITAGSVSPGIAIMSSPTEQTAVIASSLSNVSAPRSTAAIMPASSETGMNAPERPPTWLDAMTPPFFTASLSIARQAVVPWQPQTSRPISSRIRATLSPTAGVGARERSTIPKSAPRRFEASKATSWPILVILNAVFFIVSASSVRWQSPTRSIAARTTPGPETPTFTAHSDSPMPWDAPAINGLSSGTLENTTSFAQPKESLSFVSSAVFLMISPIREIASILIPERVVATLTEEQTRAVSARAAGMDLISRRSDSAIPLWTRAENPPI